MASVRFAPSNNHPEPIPRPQSTALDLRYHNNNNHYHKISNIPPSAHQLRLPSRPPKPVPVLTRPRTQSLTEHTPKLHQPTFNHLHHHPSPRSPSPARLSISAIKQNLVQTLDAFPCPLEDKLTLVAKLHAEVEAELTQLSALAAPPRGPATHIEYPDRHGGHPRRKIDDTLRLIQHADRVKAQALQQLKLDFRSHAGLSPAPHPHTLLHPSQHPSAAHTTHTSASRLALF